MGRSRWLGISLFHTRESLFLVGKNCNLCLEKHDVRLWQTTPNINFTQLMHCKYVIRCMHCFAYSSVAIRNHTSNHSVYPNLISGSFRLVTLFVPHIAAKKELDDGTAVRLVKLSHLACIWRSKNLCQTLFSKYLDGCSFCFHTRIYYFGSIWHKN